MSVEQMFQLAVNNDGEALDALLAKGVDVNARNEMGLTPLLAALGNGSMYAASYLLAKDADAKATAPDGYSTLLALIQYLRRLPRPEASPSQAQAIREVHEQVLAMSKMLLDRGCNPEQEKLQSGQRAIRDAVEVSEPLALELLKRGAKPDAQDKEGFTSLHLAARHARVKFLKAVQGKVKIDIGDNYGFTPLHEAILSGHDAVARDLVENHGASPKVQITTGYQQFAAGSDAAAIARAVGKTELADWLANHGS